MSRIRRIMSQLMGLVTRRRFLLRVLAGLYVWLCLVKLPASSIRDSVPQSWEAVLSFAAAHRLQWGSEIVYTFGPVGFLISDYYWGEHFWAILVWACGFATLLAPAFLLFARRTNPSIRLPLFLALPLLTVPLCADLGFDAIYLLSITLLGIACLPDENPSAARLVSAGVAFALLGIIKFTFLMYGMSVLFVIAATNAIARRWKNTLVTASAWIVTFCVVWFCYGQALSGIPLFFVRSLEVASGYSSAMALPPNHRDLMFGVILLFCLAALLLVCWLGSKNWKWQSSRAVLIALGIFLAWKEGFVRADIHVVVFFLYAFFVAALMPALFQAGNSRDGKALEEVAPPPEAVWAGRRWIPRMVPFLAAATVLLSLIPFATHRKSFGRAVQQGFVPRYADTLKALFSPMRFKQELEEQLSSMRQRTPLPEIKSAVGDASVAVLGLDQDVAILNGLNYVPHPIFQSYTAYTPELQRLNMVFFQSENAPEYVLWRPRTVDRRFPTLDDGGVLLALLSAYSPVLYERGFALWKREPVRREYSLGHSPGFASRLEEWFAVGDEPAWCRVELRETFIGKLESLLWSSSVARIEVKLDDGKIFRYRMVPGNARYGFVLNPLMLRETDPKSGAPLAPGRVTAARITVGRSRSFKSSIHVALPAIQGIPALRTSVQEEQISNTHEN